MSDVNRLRNFNESLAHFGRGGFNVDPVCALLEFMGKKASDVSISRWLRGNSSPNGPNMILVMYFLEWVGYRVREIDNLDKPARDLGRMIAFEVFTFEEVQARLGYKVIQSLYDALRGRETFSRTKTQVVQEMIKEGKDALETNRSAKERPQLLAGFPSVAGLQAPSTQPSTVTPVPVDPVRAGSDGRYAQLVEIIHLLRDENKGIDMARNALVVERDELKRERDLLALENLRLREQHDTSVADADELIQEFAPRLGHTSGEFLEGAQD